MTKIAIVGAGSRAYHMFSGPLTNELQGVAALVGICDTNPERARLMSEQCGGVPAFGDFDAMIERTKPDAVIVTTPDSLHDIFIIRALEAGCDVIAEKPMTTNAAKCRAILDAERRTGKRVIVTFNCRFMPYVVRVKELLREGAIGDVYGVTLEWSLDTRHGADYFRRWHRRMENSGGLLVHKSTHHFDMVNWWLDDEPEYVFANGSRQFYGPTRESRGERCATCEHKTTCAFYYDVAADKFTQSFYLGAERHDGYYRDQCVFGDNIDIYDTMSVAVKYGRGALLTYSLNAYSPYEGWRATFVGSKGRLEAGETYSGPGSADTTDEIRLYNHRGELSTLRMAKSSGEHGGGDRRLRRMLFAQDVPDVLGQQAGSRAGAMSLLIGAAANQSILELRPVRIDELLSAADFAMH